MAPPSGPGPHNSAPTSAPSPSSPPDVQQLPAFDAQFRAPSPYFYFHHVIDPVAATLQVQALGPDLTFTFTHSRAVRQGFSPSQVASSLERKTVGFITLVKPRGGGGGAGAAPEVEKRIVLAWAESGHGAGRAGDVLDSGGGALANSLWTTRAVRIGASLGIKMDRPFDKMGVPGRTREDLRGVFLASHVEVKLAVHAVYLLLAMFKIPLGSRRNQPSRRALRQLRQARWEDGSRPRFDIFFSRKNCAPCGAFVRKLAALTGVEMRLVWRDRLVRVVYQKRRGGMGALRADAVPQHPENGDDEDTEYEEDDEDSVDLVQVLPTVDLTAASQPDVDLTRDTPEAEPPDDSKTDAEAEAERDEEEGGRAAVDAYIDGLAYCVSQSSPLRAHATAAVVDLAQRMRRRARVLSKPLPATPETEPPAWMAAGAGVREPRVRLRGRSVVDGWLEG